MHFKVLYKRTREHFGHSIVRLVYYQPKVIRAMLQLKHKQMPYTQMQAQMNIVVADLGGASAPGAGFGGMGP